LNADQGDLKVKGETSHTQERKKKESPESAVWGRKKITNAQGRHTGFGQSESKYYLKR